MATAKEFLENAMQLNKLVESTRESLESLSEIHAIAPSDGSKGRMNENTELNKAVKRAELEDKLAKYIEYLWEYKEALVNITTDSEISIVSRTLIQQRYMLGKGWKQVANFLKYDEVYTRRELNDEAIREVAKRAELWEHIKFPY